MMDFVTNNLLPLILFAPTLVALLILFLPAGEKKLIRWVALLGSLIPLGYSLFLWFSFEKNTPGFQFEYQTLWYETIGSSFHVGVDGLSLTMVLLTTVLTPIAILASFSINERVKSYMILFLMLETGMLGVFLR
jgi:NADH-quinone oxidoreductase subunit M